MSDVSLEDLPLELVLDVLHFCSPDDILSLGQTSHGLRRICCNPYLYRTGLVIKNGNSAANIRLVGQPVSPFAVAFLCDMDVGALRISLICDVFHTLSFSSDIIQFLRSHSIQTLEILCLEDELNILEVPSFSATIHNILATITTSPCRRVSFTAHSERITRTLPTPCHTNLGPSSSHHLTPKSMESITELRLSSVFSRVGSLWNILLCFLQLSPIEVVSLDCEGSEDPWRILQSMTVPDLEALSLVTRGHPLPKFPNSFGKLHPKLKFLLIRSWDIPHSLQFPSMHLSLPPLSHLTISSNYSSFDIQSIAELSRLSITSFMSVPVPEGRGYCDVVESLTRALRSSTSSQHFPMTLTVSFTFPRHLDAHIRFCEENPIYQCSCSPLSKKSNPLKNIRHIEVHADMLSELFVVR